MIITTKLQKIDEEEEDDDDDIDNEGFEKLSGDFHPFGLFILKIREKLIRILEKHHVREFNIPASFFLFRCS